MTIKGKTAFVGVPGYLQIDAQGDFSISGLVEVFESDATGTTWTLTQSLLPAVPLLVNRFGQTLAASGDRLTVAEDYLIALYERRHGQWTPTETIPALYPSAMILVGDTLAYVDFGFSGVSIYEIGHGSDARLIQTLKPVPSDNGEYGSEIALRGNLLVVGSPFGSTPGRAYVYSREGLQWHLEQILYSPTGAPNSEFGSGVAISNHSIIVGAPGEDGNFNGFFTTGAGEAYVFRKSHHVWAPTQEFRPSNGGTEKFNGFATLIVAAGGRVALSAPQTDALIGADFGPVYVYRWEGDTLVPDGIPAPTANALAVSHNHIIVGTARFHGEGIFTEAEVLTYPKPSAADASDADE